MPGPGCLERVARIELAPSAWKAEVITIRPYPQGNAGCRGPAFRWYLTRSNRQPNAFQAFALPFELRHHEAAGMAQHPQPVSVAHHQEISHERLP